MKYIILSKATRDGLVGDVNKHIEHGWKPIGGIAISDGFVYYQAMVKEDSP